MGGSETFGAHLDHPSNLGAGDDSNDSNLDLAGSDGTDGYLVDPTRTLQAGEAVKTLAGWETKFVFHWRLSIHKRTRSLPECKALPTTHCHDF